MPLGVPRIQSARRLAPLHTVPRIPERVKASKAKYYAANVGRERTRSAAYYAANPERKKSYSAAYRAANPARVKAYAAAWHTANPDYFRVRNARRRTNIGTHTTDDLIRIRAEQGDRCKACQCELHGKGELDHIRCHCQVWVQLPEQSAMALRAMALAKKALALWRRCGPRLKEYAASPEFQEFEGGEFRA